MKRIYIATSRDIGEKCKLWAKENMPEGFVLTDKMNDCDIFISVLYDKIVPLEYLKGLEGAFNFHPGKLPEYRGSATFSWAIFNKEKEVGVTLHKIDEGVDTGDVIEIKTFNIEEMTADIVFKLAEMVIFKMFQDWFEKLIKGKYEAEKQDESKARTYQRRDLEKMKDLTHIVRALHFPGKESCYFYNQYGDKIYINYETLK